MAIQKRSVYDQVLDQLPIDPEGILAFKLPKRFQNRVSKLIERNSAGKLSDDERFELERFMALESAMRVLKAKALMTTLKPKK